VITGYDFLVLSVQDWDTLPTRKHRFPRWWAAAGNRVLYVEQPMHWAGWLVEIRREFSRLWRWLQGPREIAPNLWVYTLPLLLPFFLMWEPINRLNMALIRPVLRAQMRRLGFEKVILWTYMPSSADLVGTLGEQAAVYECVDDFTASKGLVNSRTVELMERRLIETVDLLIVTAEGLLREKGPGARRSRLIPNGVDVEHFARVTDPDLPVPPLLAGVKHPVIGYIGAIQYWIDTALLGRIAREHPDWTVVLVGPRQLLADMTPFEGLPNVIVTGRVPYAEMPGYIKPFDVCVNPYVLDQVAEHCSPLKLYEYVATGKPVVSVDMPEAHRFKGLIHIAEDADSFVRLVEHAVTHDDGLAAQRMAEAHKHTWRQRFEAATAALLEVLAEHSGRSEA